MGIFGHPLRGFQVGQVNIQAYAKKHKMEVFRWFRDEGVSGTKHERPALAELLIDLEENGHGIKTVIIEKVDRLARDLMVQEFILKDFKQSGFNLVSVHEGSDLMDGDPTRTLIRQVLGAVAQYDKEMTVLRLRAARERKRRKEGKCEGRKGYKDVHKHIVDEVRRLRRKPKAKPRMTFDKVADELNERGFKSASGKEFNGTMVRVLMHRVKA
jgi:DNA invertase Pin-like site-specific DNA recombinase